MAGCRVLASPATSLARSEIQLRYSSCRIMPDLYPLRLVPEFSPRPWGTRDLRPIYSDAPGTEPIGEAWLTGDNCKVANGPFAGATLGELCKRFGRELVGEAAPQA